MLAPEYGTLAAGLAGLIGAACFAAGLTASAMPARTAKRRALGFLAGTLFLTAAWLTWASIGMGAP